MDKTKKWLNLFNDKHLIESKENGYIVIYDDGYYHLGHWIGTLDFQGSLNDKGCLIYDSINEIEDELHKHTSLSTDEISKVIEVVEHFDNLERYIINLFKN